MENAKLPGNYIGIFVTSQGFAGIIGYILRFTTLEIWPDQPFVAVGACYLVSVIVCLICIPAQISMRRNSFALFYQKK